MRENRAGCDALRFVCQGLSSLCCMGSGVHELANYVREVELPPAQMRRHQMHAPAPCRTAHQLGHAVPARRWPYRMAEQQHFQLTCRMNIPLMSMPLAHRARISQSAFAIEHKCTSQVMHVAACATDDRCLQQQLAAAASSWVFGRDLCRLLETLYRAKALDSLECSEGSGAFLPCAHPQ